MDFNKQVDIFKQITHLWSQNRVVEYLKSNNFQEELAMEQFFEKIHFPYSSHLNTQKLSKQEGESQEFYLQEKYKWIRMELKNNISVAILNTNDMIQERKYTLGLATCNEMINNLLQQKGLKQQQYNVALMLADFFFQKARIIYHMFENKALQQQTEQTTYQRQFESAISKSIALYENVEKCTKQIVKSHHLQAKFLQLFTNQLEDAVLHYEKCLLLVQEDSNSSERSLLEAHIQLGYLNQALGKWTPALEHFEKVYQSKKRLQYLIKMAECYLFKYHMDKANELLKQALELIHLHKQMKHASISSSVSASPSSSFLFEKSSPKSPKNNREYNTCSVFHLLAILNVRLKEFGPAREYIEMALRKIQNLILCAAINKSSSNLQLEILYLDMKTVQADIYYELDHTTQAIRTLEEAIKLLSKNKQSYDTECKTQLLQHPFYGILFSTLAKLLPVRWAPETVTIKLAVAIHLKLAKCHLEQKDQFLELVTSLERNRESISNTTSSEDVSEDSSTPRGNSTSIMYHYKQAQINYSKALEWLQTLRSKFSDTITNEEEFNKALVVVEQNIKFIEQEIEIEKAEEEKRARSPRLIKDDDTPSSVSVATQSSNPTTAAEGIIASPASKSGLTKRTSLKSLGKRNSALMNLKNLLTKK